MKKREAQPGDAGIVSSSSSSSSPLSSSLLTPTLSLHYTPDIKGVPQFWLQVLQNNGFVAQSIFEEDEDALSFLRDIRYSEQEGETEGFTLTFHFAENPYFSNTTLSKTYHMEQDELMGELQYDHATGYFPFSPLLLYFTSTQLIRLNFILQNEGRVEGWQELDSQADQEEDQGQGQEACSRGHR